MLFRSDAAGRRPKAVIAVDLYGQCADYDAIGTLCEQYGVPLVEDAAEALGSVYRGRRAGRFGRLGVLSFNGNKIITTSGGGMLVSDDGPLVARARFLATQAREPAPHYEHRELGFNYRMSNVLAAIGRGQLRVLPERVAARRRNFRLYVEALGGLPAERGEFQRSCDRIWALTSSPEPAGSWEARSSRGSSRTGFPFARCTISARRHRHAPALWRSGPPSRTSIP